MHSVLEHVVNYANFNEADILSSAEQSTSNIGEAPKFIDTINPLLKFSNDDLEAMNDDVNHLIESDSSDDDDEDDDGSNDVDLGIGPLKQYCRLFTVCLFSFHSNWNFIFPWLENPPLNKDLRKRKRAEEDEEIKRKMFHPNVENVATDANCDGDGDGGDSQKSSASSKSKSSRSSDDESPVDRFRRGCDLPSDLDTGDNSANSSNNDDLEDDGDWNMMGAALEREFLGLDWLLFSVPKLTNTNDACSCLHDRMAINTNISFINNKSKSFIDCSIVYSSSHTYIH